MRTYEESCTLLDGIVGRCVREAPFASAVLDDPAAALKEYELNADELDDFLALRADHREEAEETWRSIREYIAAPDHRQE
jgi:hypothetical protein